MTTKALSMFARLMKVDVENRKVYGVIADETPDAANEVFDYEKSKPNFLAWSSGLAKATNGESVGNVRAMHGKVVAGKLTEMTCDDVAKAITVCADIVDNNEWDKVVKGCYTGFSIGGGYGDKVKLANGLVKYEAKPTEVSLADIPCNPNATFTLVTKSTGAKELRKFATAPDTATDDGAVSPSTSDGVALLCAKALGVDALPEGMTTEQAAVAVVLHKRLTSDDADKAEARGELAALLKAAHALYPPLFAGVDSDRLQKNLWAVQDLAACLRQLGWVTNSAIDDRRWEGDDSKVPETLKSALKLVGKALIDMCKEEVAELLASYEDEATKAAQATDLEKAQGTNLQKSIDEAGEDGLRAMVKTLQDERDELRKILADAGVPGGTPLADVPALLAKSAPTCGHTETAGDLVKVNGALDEATTALTKARADNTLLKARITALEAENDTLKKTPPQNPPPRLVAVAKTGAVAEIETGSDLEKAMVDPIRHPDGSINEAATMLKAVHAAGGVRVQK